VACEVDGEVSALRFAVSHWLYLVGAAVLLGLCALVFRGRLKRLLRLAKAAATDPRLPRPVRYLFVVALAVKCLPVDFGADEILLLVGVGLLYGPYRRQWAEIRGEISRSTRCLTNTNNK